MKILADYHHGELYQSYVLSLEKRLGYEIYRPIGKAWYDKVNYLYWMNELQIQQYLGHPDLLKYLPNGMGKLDNSINSQLIEYKHSMVTYDVFMSTHFDVLLASIPQHEALFQKLSDIHPSHPKVIFQIGNNWNDLVFECKNIINATIAKIDTRKHFINYYPEFELPLFNENISYENKSLNTFININGCHYRNIFMEIEKNMDWKFKEYGATNRDGILYGPEVKENILKSQFIWHVKREGDGYGFIIHEAFAFGRPVIVNYTDTYYCQRAGILMKPGINCIDISDKSIEKIIIELLDAYDHWPEMSLSSKQSFNENVNFEKEGEKLKKFFEELV